jgi:hypothetical protein
MEHPWIICLEEPKRNKGYAENIEGDPKGRPFFSVCQSYQYHNCYA